jgi:hypothetical protein
MDLTFGPAYARSWAADVFLPEIGHTVVGALEAGTDVKEVWRAVCQVVDVPPSIR